MNYYRYVGIIAFLLVVLSPSAVFANERTSATISQERMKNNGALLIHEGVEFHFRPSPVNNDVHIAVETLGKSARFNPPKKFRSKTDLYEYDIDEFPDQQVVVRLHYTGKKKKNIRRRVFFQDKNGKWYRLRTVINREEQYGQAILPEPSGRIAILANPKKKERPIKAMHFTPFPGVTESDTAAVIDAKSGRFLYRQEATKQRPIASVTKLMTAYVLLNSHTSLQNTVTYKSSYDREGAAVLLNNGDTLTLNDALNGILLPSANNMAVTLANSLGMPQDGYVSLMNGFAQTWGLRSTHFNEPSGLDSGNVSSAGNLARMSRHIFNEYPTRFRSAAQKRQHVFQLQNSGATKVLNTTNNFDGQGRYTVTGFKTGYYPGVADRTLVIQLQDNDTKAQIIVVLLGNPTYGTIFDEARTLADWSFDNWVFHNYR